MKLSNLPIIGRLPIGVVAVALVVCVVLLLVATLFIMGKSGVSMPEKRCAALGGVYVWKASTCFRPDAVIKVAP